MRDRNILCLTSGAPFDYNPSIDTSQDDPLARQSDGAIPEHPSHSIPHGHDHLRMPVIPFDIRCPSVSQGCPHPPSTALLGSLPQSITRDR